MLLQAEDPSIAEAFVARLPLPVQADLVLHCLQFLPPTPPAHLLAAAAAAASNHLAPGPPPVAPVVVPAPAGAPGPQAPLAAPVGAPPMVQPPAVGLVGGGGVAWLAAGAGPALRTATPPMPPAMGGPMVRAEGGLAGVCASRATYRVSLWFCVLVLWLEAVQGAAAAQLRDVLVRRACPLAVLNSTMTGGPTSVRRSLPCRPTPCVPSAPRAIENLVACPP